MPRSARRRSRRCEAIGPWTVLEHGRAGLPVNTENTAGKGPFGVGGPLLAAWRPGLVVAGRLRPAALRQCRADRAMGGGGAREIGPVRLPPRPASDLFLASGGIYRVVHAAM